MGNAKEQTENELREIIARIEILLRQKHHSQNIRKKVKTYYSESAQGRDSPNYFNISKCNVNLGISLTS